MNKIYQKDISQEIINKINELYNNTTLSCPEIAKELNLPSHTIRRILHKTHSKLKSGLLKISIPNREIIKHLYLTKEKNIKELSQIYKVNKQSIRNLLESLNIKLPEYRKLPNLLNIKFDLLLPIQNLGKINGKFKYLCQCDCGKQIIKQRSYLTSESDYKKSCGCQMGIARKQHPELNGSVFVILKRNAEARNLEFNITKEYLWNLFESQNRKCALSNEILILPKNKNEFRNKPQWNASLDRIDSSKGYIEGNVQWVTKTINKMKREWNQDFFIDICIKIADHSRNNKL